MKQFFLFLILITLFLVSCDKEECVTCTNDQLSEEVCEDYSSNFTDSNGQPIGDYESYVNFLENNGYECQ